MTPEEALDCTILAQLEVRQIRATLWTEDWRRIETALKMHELTLDALKHSLQDEVKEARRARAPGGHCS